MNEVERALAAFIDAWTSDARLDPDDFCVRHPTIATDLRRRIDEFLFTVEGLNQAFEKRPPPADAAAAANPGTLLGDYRIVREVGRGGMGVVYEAEQISLRRRVALKVLSAHLTLRPEAIARFRREAELAAKLDHRGIVAIHAVGASDGAQFIAMDFVDGVPLDRWIEENRNSGAAVDVERSCRIALQVAEALAHAHAAGVIHRDVKPSNILVRDDGSVVLTDFGLARIDSQAALTQTGEFAGTLHYASPEQLRGGRTPMDARTDVYSLGATLYELITRRRPFDGEGGALGHDVAHRVATSEPPNPRRYQRALPNDLVTIVLKALEKEPARRYASARELADDLAAFLSFHPIAARPNGVATRVVKLVRRRPFEAGVVPLLVLLAIALAIGALVQAQRRDADALLHSAELDQRDTDDLFHRVDTLLAARSITLAIPDLAKLYAREKNPEHVADRLLAIADRLRGELVPALLDPVTERALVVASATPNIELRRRARHARFQALVLAARLEEALALVRGAPASERSEEDARAARLFDGDVLWLPFAPMPDRSNGTRVDGGTPFIGSFGLPGSKQLLVDHEDGSATLFDLTASSSASRVELGSHDGNDPPPHVCAVLHLDDRTPDLLAIEQVAGHACHVALRSMQDLLSVSSANSYQRPKPIFEDTLQPEAAKPDVDVRVEALLLADLDGREGRELVIVTKPDYRRVVVYSGVGAHGGTTGAPSRIELDPELAANKVDVRAIAVLDGTPPRIVAGTGYHDGFDLRCYEVDSANGNGSGAPSVRRLGSRHVGQVTGLVANALPYLAAPHVLLFVSDTPMDPSIVEKMQEQSEDVTTLPGGAFVATFDARGTPTLLDAPRFSLTQLLGGLPTANARLNRVQGLQTTSGERAVLYRAEACIAPLAFGDLNAQFGCVLPLGEGCERTAPVMIPANDCVAGDLDGDGDDEVVLVESGGVLITGLRAHKSTNGELALSRSTMATRNDSLSRLWLTATRKPDEAIAPDRALRATDLRFLFLAERCPPNDFVAKVASLVAARTTVDAATMAQALKVDTQFAAGRFDDAVRSATLHPALESRMFASSDSPRGLPLARLGDVSRLFEEWRRRTTASCATADHRSSFRHFEEERDLPFGFKRVRLESADVARGWEGWCASTRFGRGGPGAPDIQPTAFVSLAPPVPLDRSPHRFTVDLCLRGVQYGTIVRLGLFRTGAAEDDLPTKGRVEFECQRAPRRPSRTRCELRYQPDPGGTAVYRSPTQPEFSPGLWYRCTFLSAPELGMRFIDVRPRERELDAEPLLSAIQFGAPFRDDDAEGFAVLGISSNHDEGGECTLLVDEVTCEVLARE